MKESTLFFIFFESSLSLSLKFLSSPSLYAYNKEEGTYNKAGHWRPPIPCLYTAAARSAVAQASGIVTYPRLGLAGWVTFCLLIRRSPQQQVTQTQSWASAHRQSSSSAPPPFVQGVATAHPASSCACFIIPSNQENANIHSRPRWKLGMFPYPWRKRLFSRCFHSSSYNRWNSGVFIRHSKNEWILVKPCLIGTVSRSTLLPYFFSINPFYPFSAWNSLV